jgi:hypothetical protein
MISPTYPAQIYSRKSERRLPSSFAFQPSAEKRDLQIQLVIPVASPSSSSPMKEIGTWYDTPHVIKLT